MVAIMTPEQVQRILANFTLVKANFTIGGEVTMRKGAHYFISEEQAARLGREGRVVRVNSEIVPMLIAEGIVDVPEHIRTRINTVPPDADGSGNQESGGGVTAENYDPASQFFTLAIRNAGIEYTPRTPMNQIHPAITAAGWSGNPPTRKQLAGWLAQEAAAAG